MKKKDFNEIKTRAVAERTLILSYESRQHLSQFVFESDSSADTNYTWWRQEITKLIETGKQQNYLRQDLDGNAICYSIWCFIRGFNADAISRKLPMETALVLFRSGFGCFIDGAKNQ